MDPSKDGPTLALSLALRPDGDGYEVLLEAGGREREVGRLEPSGDPSFPWLTSAGQLEAGLDVAALRLAAHVLEDEQLSLSAQMR